MQAGEPGGATRTHARGIVRCRVADRARTFVHVAPASRIAMESIATLTGPGGLPVLELVARDGARAALCTHGAHVTGWIPAGESADRLFVSAASRFAPGVPIRGGVPVCFPQFADQGPLPMHGLVHSLAWEVAGTDVAPGGAVRATLRLADSVATRTRWPHAFTAELAVTVAGPVLAVELRVSNPGDAPFAFTGALHTYLAVTDLAATRIGGLAGARYRDKFLRREDVPEAAAELRFDRPLDRVYHAAPQPLTLLEPDRSLEIRAAGFPDTVVWNPGPEWAARIADLRAGEEARFVCIEAAAARAPIVLAAGGEWLGRQVLTARAGG